MGDRLIIVENFSVKVRDLAAEDLQESRFTGTIRAEDHNKLAGHKIKRNTFQYLLAANAVCYVLCPEHLLKNENTVLVAVMHDINLAIHYADRLVFFKEGEMVGCGAPRELVSTELIKHVFNVETKVFENPMTGGPLVVYV